MHTNFPKGTPLRVKMKNGQIRFGKFFDHKSGKVILESGDILNIGDVASMSIRKLTTTVEKDNKPKIIFRTGK